MSRSDEDLIARVLTLLEAARSGKTSVEDITRLTLALQLFRQRLQELFAFPTFPEQGEGVVRLGSWDSLPARQRQAYADIKSMLGLE